MKACGFSLVQLGVMIARRVDFDETVFRRISYGNSQRNLVFGGPKPVLNIFNINSPVDGWVFYSTPFSFLA